MIDKTSLFAVLPEIILLAMACYHLWTPVPVPGDEVGQRARTEQRVGRSRDGSEHRHGHLLLG